MTSEAWLASCFAPIPGELPTGRDARHEPEHERIRHEIEKATGLSGKGVDWPLVRQEGQQLLAHKTKDLLIASYVALACAKVDGLSGLTRGLLLLSGMLEAFPDGLYPQRARARGNALAWLSERVAELSLPEQCTRAEADELKRSYRALSGNMRERLGDDSPGLSELSRLVDRLGLSASEPEPPPLAPPIAVATSAGPLAPHNVQDLLLAPIPGDNPAGSDVSQHDAWFAVQAEVEKLQSLDGLKPNWPVVVSRSSELLTTHGKDFTVAGYLTVGLLETGGLPALARGLATLAGLLDTFWEHGFPPLARVKRRSNALSWAIERIAAALPRFSPTSSAQRTELDDALTTLEAALARRLPVDAVSLAPLRTAVAALAIADAPAALPPSTPSAVAPTPSAGEPTAVNSTAEAVAEERTVDAVNAPREVPGLTDVAGLEPFLAMSGERLVEAAGALFEASAADPRAYRLLRIGLWLELDELPPAQQADKTRVRPPDRRAREALQAMVAAGRWDSVVVQSEGLLRRNPLWLETCWLSARALGELGESHQAALAAVESESRALAQRLPRLLELHFLDGAPFVSAEAAAWFRAGSSDPGAPKEADPVELEWTAALTAALGGGSSDAFLRVDQLLRQAPSGRAAFRMRISLAKALEEAGRLDTAADVYLGLERDIDSHDLERWEPELAATVFGRLCSLLSRRALTVSAADAQRVRARLAKLSPFALG